jgi:hypothetical protein
MNAHVVQWTICHGDWTTWKQQSRLARAAKILAQQSEVLMRHVLVESHQKKSVIEIVC